MRVSVPIGQKAIFKAHSEKQGESLNSYIIRAMTETMEWDNVQAVAE